MYTLRITFKSITKLNNLKKFLLKLKQIKSFKNIKINGLFNIKKKDKIFTVLKSPHVNKKSREHFIYKNYNQKIDVNFDNFYQLLDFLFIIKKTIKKNFLLQTKIIKY